MLIFSYKNLYDNRSSTQVESFVNRLGTYTYTYDVKGNITQEAFVPWSNNVQSYEKNYTYDALNQLTGYADTFGNQYYFEYDYAGNITCEGYCNGDNPLQYRDYIYDNSWKDKLTKYCGFDITYDEIGNPISYLGANLTWSEGRRLASYSKNGTNITFNYDADGKRISKNVNGHAYFYTYNQGTLVAVSSYYDGLLLKFIVDEKGDYVGFINNDVTYYYVRNLQNDVVGISDTNGNVIVTYSYDPWGKVTAITAGEDYASLGELNPIRYRGYFYDTETGLYYLQSRYYDPETNRFLNADEASVVTVSPDSANHDKNLFAYCDNNPVVRADEGGAFWCFVLGATVVSGLISGLTTAVSNIAKKEPINKGLGMAILAGAASGFVSSVAGPVLSVVGNAAVSMAENAINQVVDNKGFNDFNVGDMLIDGVIGGVSSAIGGKIDVGIEKQAANLGKQAVNRTVNTLKHKGIKPALKEGAKAFSYYNKNTVSYYTSVGKNMFREGIISFFSKIVR